MLGSTILEVAIGLALLFLMLSLVASAVREGIEGVIKARAVNLERGIRMLLNDAEGTGLARAFYEHPLIRSLYSGTYSVQSKRFFGGELPTYIPAKTFSAVVIDLVRRGSVPGQPPVLTTPPVTSVADLQDSVGRMASPFVQRALLTAIDGADGDLNRLRTNLDEWFNSAMNSVSGWYRRRTQLYLFVIGLGVALVLNVNTFTVADHLWRDQRAREALAARAERIATDTAYQRRVRDSTATRDDLERVYTDLQTLNLPIGWDRRPPAPPDASPRIAHFSYWSKQVLGLALTAFAIMLGAPFWFDILNKVIVIRSTVKPREKTDDEGSEDRQTPKSKDRARDAIEAGQGQSPPVSPGRTTAPTSG
jgi:hypothetical protein